MIKLLALGALVGAGWLAYDSREDIKRYLRMRAM
ncbi:DUF6893 family small protein [Actinomycetospora sp.]|jgi:hypothetical protein